MVGACSSNTISYRAGLALDDDGEPSLLVNVLLPSLLLMYMLTSEDTDFSMSAHLVACVSTG